MIFLGIGMGVGAIITGFIIEQVSVKAVIYSQLIMHIITMLILIYYNEKNDFNQKTGIFMTFMFGL